MLNETKNNTLDMSKHEAKLEVAADERFQTVDQREVDLGRIQNCCRLKRPLVTKCWGWVLSQILEACPSEVPVHLV